MSLKKDYLDTPKLNGGPGGWRCACCNPYGCNPRLMKAKARRLIRRANKQALSQGSVEI